RKVHGRKAVLLPAWNRDSGIVIGQLARAQLIGSCGQFGETKLAIGVRSRRALPYPARHAVLYLAGKEIHIYTKRRIVRGKNDASCDQRFGDESEREVSDRSHAGLRRFVLII